jgi:hypothetical protein
VKESPSANSESTNPNPEISPHPTLSLARKLQLQLERLYQLEDLPHVDQFAYQSAEFTREMLLVRQEGQDLELGLSLPQSAWESSEAKLGFDEGCQIIEGVSHFVMVVERVRRRLPVTQLELELQAEVDKYVMIARSAWNSNNPTYTLHLHRRLYERVAFVHEAHTEEGKRYRMANELAARFCARLTKPTESKTRQAKLLKFFHAGQEEKIRMAHAA